MNVQTLLRIGERVDLRIDKQVYSSVIQDMPTETALVVLHPLDRRNVAVHLEYDIDIEIVFYRPNGQYSIITRLSGRVRVGNMALANLSVISQVPERLQRRSGFRLPYRAGVRMVPYRPAVPTDDVYTAFTTDLSEGGMQIEYPRMIGLGMQFDIHFTLVVDTAETLVVRGAISRMIPPDEVGGLWRLGLRFLECPEDARRAIARFILLEQVNRRFT